MGRPTKLTPENQAIIIKAIGLGATYKAAANAAEVSYDSLNLWLKKGKKAKSGRYFKFYYAIKKALGDRQARWLSQIERAAENGTWQAAAWKLERTEREHFGRQRLDVEHGGEIKIQVIYDDLDD